MLCGLRWKGRIAALLLTAALPVGAVVAVPGVASAVTCNKTATSAWANNCTVQRGDSSNMVEAVQWVVLYWAASGGHPLSCGLSTIDGIFGPATETAVKCFQSHNGLQATGVVSGNTWAKLQSETVWNHTASGWAYYDTCQAVQCATNIFRQWTASGIWYVKQGQNGGDAYHRMDTSGP